MLNGDRIPGTHLQVFVSRRSVSRLLGGAGALALLQGAIGFQHGAIGAQDDNESSGHGRGRGRGRGGDDADHDEHDEEDTDEEGEVVQIVGDVPANALEIRIVSDDAGGFSPTELTLDLGQSIAFVNAHDDEHTATGSGFDTGIIAPGAIATVSLNAPGVFFYACQIHPEMTGTINVRDASGEVPTRETIATPTGGISISIENLAFNPSQAAVTAGATVVWTNNDSVPHTVTGDDGAFDSGIFDPGASFSWTFEAAGSFAYSCQLHPQMQGAIVVSGDPVAVQNAEPEPSPVSQTGEQSDASRTFTDVHGPWMMELAPDASIGIQGARALFTFHEDGTLYANFVNSGDSVGQMAQFGPAHGEWSINGDQIHVSLAVLVLDEAGAFGGITTIEGDLDFASESDVLEGKVSIAGTSAVGGAMTGTGILRGLQVPLGA